MAPRWKLYPCFSAGYQHVGSRGQARQRASARDTDRPVQVPALPQSPFHRLHSGRSSVPFVLAGAVPLPSRAPHSVKVSPPLSFT